MIKRSVNPSLDVWARTGKSVLIRNLLSKHPQEIDNYLVWSVVEGSYAPASHYLNCLKVLVEYGASVDIRDTRGLTPLHVCRTREMAELLIECGADIEAKDCYGRTPLGYRLDNDERAGSYAVAEFLMSRGADYGTCGYLERLNCHYTAMVQKYTDKNKEVL